MFSYTTDDESSRSAKTITKCAVFCFSVRKSSLAITKYFLQLNRMNTKEYSFYPIILIESNSDN